MCTKYCSDLFHIMILDIICFTNKRHKEIKFIQGCTTNSEKSRIQTWVSAILYHNSNSNYYSELQYNFNNLIPRNYSRKIQT